MYPNPADYTGEPTVVPPGSQFSTTTCNAVGSSTQCITEYPANFYVQDRGNVAFGLSVIIVILSFAFILYVFNLFSRKKPIV